MIRLEPIRKRWRIMKVRLLLIADLAWSTSLLIILFTISYDLTLMIIFIIPLYAIVTRFYSKKNKVLVREGQDVTAEQSANLAEKFSGINLVKAYST